MPQDPPTRRHLLRGALALLLALGLAGCNLMRTAYDNADWFLAHRADEFFDLDQAQTDWLRQRIRDWQADNGPPLLADFRQAFDDLHRDASDSLSANEARAVLDRAEVLLKRSADQAIPILAELMAGLAPDQVEHLEWALQERNDEYRSKYLHGDRAERKLARADRVVNRVERWTGSLSRAQRATVRQMADEWPDITEAWLNYRIDRQQQLLARLRAGADRAELEAFLRDWVVERSAMPDDLRANRERYRQLFVDLATVLDPTLDDAQRAEFLENIAAYRDRIDSILAR